MSSTTKMLHIALHHSGGTQDNPLASSLHLTAQDINEYHREEWNTPALLNSPYPYVGYNFLYHPNTRGFTQHRSIGEQTIAQRGHNFDTISLCIIGNYSRVLLPAHKKSVDELSSNTIEDITRFLVDLLDGNKREWAVQSGTTLVLSPFRIKPHRFYTPTTECYGSFISDDFFMRQVLQEKHRWLGALIPFLSWLNSFNNAPPLGMAGDTRDAQC